MALAAPLIRVERLARTYRRGDGDVHALADATLALQRGDFLAITGRSGSGKSTLLQLLGALDRPTSGQYWLDGEDVFAATDRELCRLRSRRIGFVFQTFHLLDDLTVLENVELPFLYRRESRAEARRRARHALDKVGLGPRLGHTPNTLSGGEMQRVAIARAIAGDPDLILADEPTGNLDAATGHGILELLGELHAEGATIVLVTHDREVAARAGAEAVMQDGVLGGPTP